ncbi:MAG: phosphoglycerate dehydrogenase [Deltaproteobacteria bacterium]|nr:phosphoglycerate dehydrogenase [Deltaproteobacteria bacterium]
MKKNKLDVVFNPLGRKLNEDELWELLDEYKPLGMLAGTEPITSAVLQKAKAYLRAISRVGVGWDNVDKDAADMLGIQVYRTRGVLTQTVAELTIGLILSALRLIYFHDRLIRQGQWEKRTGSLLQGKTVGIVGFGDIGQRVGELISAFDGRVIYYDPEPISVSWAKAVSMSDLFARADIISIHASGNKTIFGPEEFKACKQGAILVNTARGELVDENALHDALVKGRVSFACLDVFEKEPYCGPLCSLDNVILTPHIGSYAREARHLMECTAVKNLIKGLHKAGFL